MKAEQRALAFECAGCRLYGIIGLPATPNPRGVLIVTGGPQYRAGSHRQFTLLARDLAQAGFPVMRFDYRGMGDSEGEQRGFEDIGDDLDCALREFFASVPDLRELVIWGLCDGATAAAMHAWRHPRVRGLILLNPWVRTGSGIARATLRHYYPARLIQPAFWRKLLTGRFDLGTALASLWQSVAAARGRQRGTLLREEASAVSAASPAESMYDGLSRFQGRTLLILSGDDLTAREFADLLASSPAWRALGSQPGLSQVDVAEANHTFSRAIWREQVSRISAQWLASW
jgi:exosortase A-associated hydrolase 1